MITAREVLNIICAGPLTAANLYTFKRQRYCEHLCGPFMGRKPNQRAARHNLVQTVLSCLKTVGQLEYNLDYLCTSHG